jgi:hypothetical protein
MFTRTEPRRGHDVGCPSWRVSGMAIEAHPRGVGTNFWCVMLGGSNPKILLDARASVSPRYKDPNARILLSSLG